MKTRIKIVTLGDGSQKYFPQYRLFFIWWHFTDFFERREAYYSLKSAQNFLNAQIKRYNDNKIINTKYSKYP